MLIASFVCWFIFIYCTMSLKIPHDYCVNKFDLYISNMNMYGYHACSHDYKKKYKNIFTFPSIFIKFLNIGNQFIFHALKLIKQEFLHNLSLLKNDSWIIFFFPFKSSDIFMKCYHTSWNIQTCIMVVSVLIRNQFIFNSDRVVTLVNRTL